MLLCTQLPDLPLSTTYPSALVNSINLLLDLAVPAVARVGVSLDAVPDSADVLTLAAIRCCPQDILRRFNALFAALTAALLEPPFAKPGSVSPTPLPVLMKLLTNVRLLQVL